VDSTHPHELFATVETSALQRPVQLANSVAEAPIGDRWESGVDAQLRSKALLFRPKILLVLPGKTPELAPF